MNIKIYPGQNDSARYSQKGEGGHELSERARGNRIKKFFSYLIIVLLFLLSPLTAFSGISDQISKLNVQQEIDACSDVAEGGTCVIKGVEASAGTCKTMNKVLECVPNVPYFNVLSSTVILPEINAGSLGTYYLTMSLNMLDPVTFELNLDSVRSVKPSGKPVASYDPDSGKVVIPVLRIGTDLRFGVKLILTPLLSQSPSLEALRFELTSMGTDTAPDNQRDLAGGGGSSPGDYAADNGVDAWVEGCGQIYEGAEENWTAAQAKIHVNPRGISVDGVFKEGTQDFIVDCENDPYLPNPVTGGEVWGIAVVGKVQGVEIRNCIVENNQLQPNVHGPGATSLGGGILLGAGVAASVHNNTIRFNGSGVSPGSHTAAVDNDTTTEWISHSGVGDSHFYFFTFDVDTTISKLRIFTGTANLTWNVYFGPQDMLNPDVKQIFEEYKVINGASVGGLSGWVELTPSLVLSQRRLWIVISGGPIKDHLFELQYESGGVWYTPEQDLVFASSSLKGGNAGVIMRCTYDAQLRDNIIYSNANNAIGARGARGTIGPNNEIYESGVKGATDLFSVWTLAVIDHVDLNIYDNNFHGIGKGIGLQYVSGNVDIINNDFHDFPNDSKTRGIGRQTMTGDLNLNISNNRFWNNPKITTIQMDQNHDHHLDFIFNGNTITGGYTGMKIRYNDNADLKINNNSITGSAMFGINLLDNGSADTVTNMIIGSNTISDNQRTGIRLQGLTNATATIENNTLAGNSWNPPADNINTHDSLHFKGAENSNFIISGNTVSSSAAHPNIIDDGIGFKENVNTNVTISNNTISNHPESGIKFSDNSGGGLVNISGNTISNNDVVGIHFKNNEVENIILANNEITTNGSGEKVRFDGISPSDNIEDSEVQTWVDGCGDIYEGAGDYLATAEQAKIYVNPQGIHVDGVLKEGDQNFIIDCENDPFLPNPVTGAEVWGIAAVGSIQGVEIRNCIVENNQLQPNVYGPGATSLGGGILLGPGVAASVHNNTIRLNGSGVSPGSHIAVVDGDTTTEWRTYPGLNNESNFYFFTLDVDTAISKLRVFTGSVSRTWNVYFGPSNIWKPDSSQDFEEYKVVNGASVGGTSGWVELTPSQVLSQRRLWIVISGGPVDDHMFELQYESGGVWYTPEQDVVFASSALRGGNAGVVMRCTYDAQLHDNIIYSNANNAIGVRGAKGAIGPNNQFYESGVKRDADLLAVWTIAVSDHVDLSIHDNDLHGIGKGIGLQYVSGNVDIINNDFYGFPNDSKTRGIGRQAMIGDLNLNISNNRFLNNPQITTFQMEQNHDHHLDFTFDSNTITGGLTAMKIRYNDNADIKINNNSITDSERFGINLLDNGSADTVTNITIGSNTISDNQRTGIRIQGLTNATATVENNTLVGNSWSPPANNINTHDSLHFKGAADSTFIISGNTVSSSAAHPDIINDGIRFKENVNTNVTISDNIISNHPEAGIKFSDNTGGGLVNISGNTITNNDLLGIYFKNNELEKTTLFDNEITYNGIGQKSDDWGGMRFFNNDNVHVEANHFAYNTGIALRFKDSSNVFVGWKAWDPLNIDDPANPRPGEPYCYPYPAGSPYYPKGTVPWCKYASNMRAVSEMSPCGPSYFDPDPDHSWDNADLWDNIAIRRQPGTGTNLFFGNSSWAIQFGAISENVTNVKFQGNVVSGNGGPGFGFKGANGYTLNAEVYANTITDNPGGDGIQVNSGASVKVNNSRVVGGDAVQTKGGHLDIVNGNHFNIILRAQGSANVYNYNYIGCINRCAGGMGGNKTGQGSYDIEHYNCIGGHVPFDSDYMEIHDHNWFDAGDTFEVHEGGGIRLYDGNRLAGGYYRKNHSGTFQLGDCNATEPNYFPNGITMDIRSGNVCGNWINGGRLTGGDGGIIARCNVGSANVGTGAGGSNGNVGCEGNEGSWSPDSCANAADCDYWTGENGWLDFCSERNCTAPISPYW